MYVVIWYLCWRNNGSVQIPQLDRDAIEWDCTRPLVESLVIEHSGTRANGNFVELDASAFDVRKIDSCQLNWVYIDTCKF